MQRNSSSLLPIPAQGQEFVFAIIQLDSPFEPVDMMLVTDNGFEGFDEGSIVGHHCASKAVSVAAIDYVRNILALATCLVAYRLERTV